MIRNYRLSFQEHLLYLQCVTRSLVVLEIVNKQQVINLLNNTQWQISYVVCLVFFTFNKNSFTGGGRGKGEAFKKEKKRQGWENGLYFSTETL